MTTYRQLQLAATVFDQLSLNLFRSYHTQYLGGKLIWVLGFITGGTAYFVEGLADKIAGLGVGNSYWNVCSSLAGCIIGKVFWKETFTLRSIAGIATGVCSLYLLDGAPVVQH